MNENDNEMLNGMIEQLGGDATAQENTPAPETEPGQQEQPQETETESGTEEQTQETEPAQQTEEQFTDDSAQKMQQAFIYMRQQNKQLNGLLKGVAGLIGLENVDVNDEPTFMQAIQDRITANQAEQNKVPVELMQRLNDLEQKDRAHTAEQLQQNAIFGFQRVKDTFGLDQKQLNKFANDLIASGINPLERQVDLIREFKIMHWDDEMKRAADEAVAAEQKRAASAHTQSSTPNKTTSGPDNSNRSGKINSVRDLENWARNQ